MFFIKNACDMIIKMNYDILFLVMMMKIKSFTLGPYRSNCYIIYREQEAIIVDPGYDSEEVIDFIHDNQLKITSIYATHGHIDHVSGIKKLKELFNPMVYAPKKDRIWFIDSIYNHVGYEVPVDQYIDEGFELFLKDAKFIVYETPGHSEGGTILYNKQENICFSGDTLFYQTIGRTDLPFASFSQIKKSVEKMYDLLLDQTILYPGHGRTTTIGHEKKNNMFIKDKKQT